MGNATLIIKIQDIQNKPPYFTGQPYNAKIPEETPIGTPVSTDYMFKYIFHDLIVLALLQNTRGFRMKSKKTYMLIVYCVFMQSLAFPRF